MAGKADTYWFAVTTGAGCLLMSWIWLFTIVWATLTLAYPLFHEHFGGLYFRGSTLGETGDFLSGWLTPLAFLWFVVAVVLQRAELKRQREELELMRQEYAQSRKVAEEQASHLKESSLVGAREVFMKLFDESKEAMVFNAYEVQNHLAKVPGTGATPEVYGMSANVNLFLHQFAALLRGFIKQPDRMGSIKEASHRAAFIELLQSIVRLHESLKTEAEKVQLLDYYMYIHHNSPLGDVVSRAEFILRRSNTLDQPAN